MFVCDFARLFFTLTYLTVLVPVSRLTCKEASK